MSARPPSPDHNHTRSDGGAETILAAVRAAGGRVTVPRRAVLDALLDGDEHPTAHELAEKVQRAHPDVAVSTIYRILEHLEELGVLVHVHLGHGPAVYHFADQNHVHLVCQTCGQTTTLPNRSFRTISTSIRNATGFQADLAHFSITGLCEHCAAGATGSRPV